MTYTLGEAVQAALMLEMIDAHNNQCQKHLLRRTMPTGIIGVDAAGERFICNWCDTAEKFNEPFPFTVNLSVAFLLPTDERIGPWMCRMMSQGDEFYIKHKCCAPDRAAARRARLVKAVTDDGITDMNDHVKIGTAYTVYPNTIKELTYSRAENRSILIKRASIWVEGTGPRPQAGWMPLELLEIEGTRQ
jgi:hypothetical protein